MITLYQMPVSHYCEKVRWALARKHVPHRYKNLLPGLHIKPMKRLSGQSSVPVIKEGRTVVHGASAILDYLDESYPRFPLMLEDEALNKEAQSWEAWADEEIGPAVRILVYSVLLDRPDVLLPMFAQDGPWYSRWVMPKAFPKIKSALTKLLPVNADSVAKAQTQLDAAVAKVVAALDSGEFLVGDQFSRADLSVAALLAPLYRPARYGIFWPESIPLPLQEYTERYAALEPWVMSMYQRFR